MDKEKEIEAMAHWSGACEHPDRHCLDRYGDCSECSTYAKCEGLFNAGYGDVKQARKETAKEIYEKVRPLLALTGPRYGDSPAVQAMNELFAQKVKEIFEPYGVEVKE